MTTEPRQEAERIVAGFHTLIATSHTGTSRTEMFERGNRLVDVLAAAIELHDSAVGRNNRSQWVYVEASEEHMQALSRALSALREDET